MSETPLGLSAATEKKAVAGNEILGSGGCSPPLQVVRSNDNNPPVVDRLAHDRIGIARDAHPHHSIYPLLYRIDNPVREHEIHRQLRVCLNQIVADRADMRATERRRCAHPKHPTRFNSSEGGLGLINLRNDALRAIEELLPLLSKSESARGPKR
jgi:hypothetical protein